MLEKYLPLAPQKRRHDTRPDDIWSDDIQHWDAKDKTTLNAILEITIIS